MTIPATHYLQIHPADNVLVALQDFPAHARVEFGGRTIELTEPIPAKHKLFLHDMAPGAEVIMYGGLVGKTQHFVAQGSRMSTANTAHAADAYAYRGWQQQAWTAPDTTRFAGRTFNGYHRADGRVGTANYWLVVPLVFCENRNLDTIKEALHHELGYATTGKYRLFAHDLLRAYQEGHDLQGIALAPATTPARARVFPNIDGIKFLNHSGGCGGTRQDADTLSELLAAYADHPNVAGVTVLSLGCQHLQTANFLASLRRRNPAFDKPLLTFEQQLMDSEEQVITEAIRQTFAGLTAANRVQRQPAPLSALSIGVKCGGSDGFSGISANPAVGYAADLLVALGGQVLLAEFPELCGAEQNILDRCPTPDLAERFVQLMGDYDALATKLGSGFYMNPSPGNIADGLITDAIKSAGAAKKGGTSPVADVLDYTEPARRPGLALVCTPGNDVEATTGQAAAGATLILFTTGLGTPTGNPVCPVIKVATNSSLAHRLADLIDIDAGPIIDGRKTVAEMGEEILDYCVRAASGEVIPKAVGLGQDDFIPWKRGVSL